MDNEMTKIAFKMIARICGPMRCSECPLEMHNTPFTVMRSICISDRHEYTDEIVQYIGEWYHKLVPDGELVLPKQINISAEDILEVFK